ncbi:multiple coagulation factor deficiency protein 2 homolog [Ornithodoros turicata]|uniref:multiple coagulation factor deficiency protein 2 homolog n=1 Tax=Ornithodoros turicata TaxID=34597 RepID=UPI0031389546
MAVVQTLCVAVCVVTFLCPLTCLADEADSAAAEQIKAKYGAKNFVRDMEHLKEDLAKITELQMEGKLTDEEMIFYFFRMHDFDDNNMLDGLELLAAMRHTETHSGMPSPSLEDLVAATDAMLELDKDKDGFLNYFELRSAT